MKRCAAALVFVVALAGCSDGPADVLSEATGRLDEIDSGVLHVRLVATGTGEIEGEQFGFELEGPFQMPAEGELPLADLTYTQIAGEESDTSAFVADGQAAYVEIEGVFYELPEDRVASLRGGPESEDVSAQLEELEVHDWIVDPEIADGPDVAGDATRQIRGELDVVEAINDLFSIAQQLGAGSLAGVPRIEGEDAEQLENAVADSSAEVLVGEEDGLLRRLAMDIEFEADATEEVKEALGSLGGVGFSFEMEIASPNEDVSVEAPPDAQPLPSG